MMLFQTNEEFIEDLEKKQACKKGIEWVKDHGYTNTDDIILNAKRADYIAWLSMRYNLLDPAYLMGFVSDCFVECNHKNGYFLDKPHFIRFGYVQDKILDLIKAIVEKQNDPTKKKLVVDLMCLIDCIENNIASNIIYLYEEKILDVLKPSQIRKLTCFTHLHDAYRYLGLTIAKYCKYSYTTAEYKDEMAEDQFNLYLADGLSYALQCLSIFQTNYENRDNDKTIEELKLYQQEIELEIANILAKKVNKFI